jgi:hypothetical protein
MKNYLNNYCEIKLLELGRTMEETFQQLGTVNFHICFKLLSVTTNSKELVDKHLQMMNSKQVLKTMYPKVTHLKLFQYNLLILTQIESSITSLVTKLAKILLWSRAVIRFDMQ